MAPDAIYLDHQATTPLDDRVAAEMAPWLGRRFGHPASRHHAFGWDAEKALETARARVADLLGAAPREIVFTGGGAEADALALVGAAEALEARGRHVLASTVERTAIREALAHLARRGWEVEGLPVDGLGRVDPRALDAALRDDTVLVSVQVANPETGTIQDTAALGRQLTERGILFHADATAAAGWIPLDVTALGVSLLSLTGHLFHGPMGIGALYVRRARPRVRLVPRIFGGGTEGPARGGTVNLPGAVGLGRAAQIARAEGADAWRSVAARRDALEGAIAEGAGDVLRLGDPDARLPHASALTVEGVEGEALLLAVPSVAFATGSACSSATMTASHVLQAMGLDKVQADTSIRFGLGRFTTDAEVETAASRVVDAIARLRSLA